MCIMYIRFGKELTKNPIRLLRSIIFQFLRHHSSDFKYNARQFPIENEVITNSLTMSVYSRQAGNA